MTTIDKETLGWFVEDSSTAAKTSIINGYTSSSACVPKENYATIGDVAKDYVTIGDVAKAFQNAFPSAVPIVDSVHMDSGSKRADICMSAYLPDLIKYANCTLEDLNRMNKGEKRMIKIKKRKQHSHPDNPHKIFIGNVSPTIVDIYVSRKKSTVAIKWSDGKTTKARARNDEEFDLETGVAVAILKKVIISHHHLQKTIKALVKYSDKDA